MISSEMAASSRPQKGGWPTRPVGSVRISHSDSEAQFSRRQGPFLPRFAVLSPGLWHADPDVPLDGILE